MSWSSGESMYAKESVDQASFNASQSAGIRCSLSASAGYGAKGGSLAATMLIVRIEGSLNIKGV